MNRGGRPCHKYWEEGNFEKYYEGQKLFAYCSYCKKVIRHSAENRLRDHRKQCQEDKLQNETVENPGEIIFIVDENIENNADVSATSHSTDILITNTSCNVASSSSQLLKRPVLLPIDGNQEGSSSNKKRKLDSFVDKISDADKSVIDNQLMKFLCGCNITFDVVESCHFKNLIKLLKPAYKLPSKDIMNTTLLDTMYQQLTKNNSSNCEKLDKILMVSQINHTADIKHIIGVLYSKNKENLFLKLWTLAGNENDVSEIIHDAVKTAKLKYNADVYAVIAGDNLCINDNGLDLWFFECQATIAKKITKSLLNNPLISKVRTLLNAFNTPQLKQEIINRGGMKFELLNDNESCFFIKDILNACLKNRLIMKQIVATGEFTFQNDIIMTLFDSTSSSFSSSSFEEDLRKIICLYEHFCSLISKCENSTESIADITEEWLKIESAIVEEYRGCMDEICEQISSIMSPMLLAANFLHPVYRGHMFENNTERVTAVFEYLLGVLDSEGLDDYHAFSKGKGLFEKLSQHKIVDPEKYWDYAEKKHPSLTKFASKLMQVPASVLQIKFQSLCKNDISNDNGKMIELYYQLKLKDKNVTDKY
ncbi:uncharacterized protein LOC143898423 [Temnothorax americanus]|uniref:uncharacterized protein LOC143898423 n=1 Tax=Temnothorax americanus TaxID=1964332 RepID=UPI004067AAE8